MIAPLVVLAAFAASTPLPVEPEADPFARLDPFLKISADDLRTRWSAVDHDEANDDPTAAAGASSSHSSSSTLDAAARASLSGRLAALDALRETTYIDVRLVGFDGDGEHELRMGEDALQRLVDAASYEDAQHVVHPRPGAPHELPVRRRFLFQVKPATNGLATRISKAVAKSAESGGGLVPVKTVDELVRADYLRQRGSHVAIYVLNPRAPNRPPTDAERMQASAASAASVASAGGAGNATEAGAASAGWRQRLRYSYVDDDAAAASAAGAGAPHPSQCPVTRWLGSGEDGKAERYLWIDLSAGPVAYGPGSLGEGVVTEHSLPSVASLARRFSQPQSLVSHMAVELAALCVATARQLLAPPAWWLPERFYNATRVVAVRIADVPPADVPLRVVDAAATDAADEWEGLVGSLRAQLAPLALSGQAVTVESLQTSLAECKLCAAALAAATKTHSTLVAGPDGTATEIEHQHVDSALLVGWLRRFRPDLPGLYGRARHPNERLVPVLVYSVAAARPLLLDGTHVSLAFRDMVLAVQTRPPPGPPPSGGNGATAPDAEATAAPQPASTARPLAPLAEQCAGTGRWLDASALARPLLASVLQTGWGVAPSGVVWSSAHQRSVNELLWSVGPTPFGAYASRAQLSFALRDAASRTSLHALGAEVVREVASLRTYYREFGKQVEEVLTPTEHLPFVRRLNVLAHKLQRARSYLSLHSFRIAQYYLLSTWHDLRAMRAILAEGGRNLEANLVCA
jgi:hypothetical protein